MNKQIQNYMRNLRRHAQNDGRSAYFWSNSTVKHYIVSSDQIVGYIESMRTAVETNCTVLYVSAWCKANHLVGD